MAATLVANTVKQGTGAGTTTTNAIDTTGASILIVAVSGAGGAALSDSKGNVWIQVVTVNTGPGLGVPGVRLYYSLPTSVGSGHTFSDTSGFAGVAVQAWSGVTAIPTSSAGQASGTTVTASITPLGGPVPALLVSGLHSQSTGTYAIDAGFTISGQEPFLSSNSYGIGMAYLSTSSAQSPTWTWGSTTAGAIGLASFIITGSGAGGGGSYAYA